MTLQLVDNTWALKLDTSFDANVSQHYIGTYINPYVVVNVSSDDVLPDWQQAGSIGQAVMFSDDYAHGEFKALTLDKYLLLQFPLLTGNTYDLYYFPFPRLVTAKVKVWEYSGETVDADLKQLISALKDANVLNSQLAGVEQKLCELTQLVKLIGCQRNGVTDAEILRLFGYY